MIICWRDYEEGEFVVLEREFNLIEKRRKILKELEFYVVYWLEVELKNFECGM